MAYWSKSVPEFNKIDSLIRRKPGIRQAEIARALGVARSTVARRLCSMENAGYLYSEDARGGIWPFKHIR